MIDSTEISNSKVFTDTTLAINKDAEKKQNTNNNQLFDELLCQNKGKEHAFDFNLLFSPFNPTNKAFYSFIPFLKKKLKKGDVILDIGNTTRWSTVMLSALFPDQKIICIPGETTHAEHDLAYWFDNHTSNVETLFRNLNGSLPVLDKSVSLVFGKDILPEPIMTELLQELLRVANNDAIIMFTNVDLANPRPNPNYEYDTELAHDLAYEGVFGKLTDRKSYVFSEFELFRVSNDKDYHAKADPNTNYHNGLLALTNNELDLERELSAFNYFDYFDLDKGYLLPNPVLETDINNVIKIRKPQIEKQIEQHLELHPAYAEWINNTVGYTLSEEERIIVYWAKKCRSCQYIQQQLKTDSAAFRLMIEKLQHMDILQILPLNPNHVRIQHYFAYQEFTEAPENLNLRYMWNRAVASFPGNQYILDRNDNTNYTYREFDEIVKFITSTLIQNNIGKGDKVILHADINFEAMGLFWACMQLGIIFMPINSSVAEPVIERLIEKHAPKAIFLCRDAAFCEKWGDKIVFFDNFNDGETNVAPCDRLYFSEWLKDSQELDNLPEINENDLAVILHTSGSTGIPKGVKQANGQLFLSAVNTTRAYSWTGEDRNLSTNDLDSTVGFRIAFTATVQAGAACVIPTAGDRNNPAELLTCIYETGTTCLSTGPGLLKQLLTKKDVTSRLEKVRVIFSAGSALTTHLKTEFFEKTNKRISNVYGITEAAGIAIGEPLNSTNLNGNFIGYSVDPIVRIVDDNRNQVKIGEIGELLLYGSTIFKGYYSDDEPNANELQQWYPTGDLAEMCTDGSIKLTGRKKDFMKNARGEIIYFSEIEEVLSKLSFIGDLGLTSFFKDESERGALFIELNQRLPAPENIVEEIKKELTNKVGTNKFPSVIKVIDKIPRNKYGKLLKPELAHYL